MMEPRLSAASAQNEMAPSHIRVLVVDDSVFMRSMLKDALSRTDGIEVIGSAQNGLEGLKQIRDLKPDVVTLDVEMPGLDGLQVLERVMKECPLPVVMVSTKTQKGAKATLDALQLGAVDYVAKPLGEKSATLDSFRSKVTRAVQTAAASNRATLGKPRAKIAPVESTAGVPAGAVVVIGISAGGPATLHQMLPALPQEFPPILIAQHMPAGFTEPFAKRLDQECQGSVKEAHANDLLRPGLVFIAPGNRHLRVVKKGNQLAVSIDSGPKVAGFRPSVDVLFESVASAVGNRAVGVVMTGMGCDGAVGVRLLKQHGARTIAQDQATSVVYGMPKAASATGYVDRVVALADIPAAIMDALHEPAVCP